MDVNLFRKWDNFLTYQENITIFKHVLKTPKDLPLSKPIKPLYDITEILLKVALNTIKPKSYVQNDSKNQHTSPKVFIFLSIVSYKVSTYVSVYRSVFIYMYITLGYNFICACQNIL